MAARGWSIGQTDCRSLFEQSDFPMWIFEGPNVVEVNRAAVLTYGYSRDEFLGMTIRDIEETDGPPDAPSSLSPPAGEVDQTRRATWKHRKKDGDLIEVEVSAFAITFDGKPALLASVLDVSYRFRTEAQARYLDVLLATVTDAVVATDDNFILTGWNAAAESTYGRRAEEVLGQPEALVLRTGFIGVERAEAIQRLVETGRFHGELTHRRGDGKRVHIESRAVAFFDTTGKRLGYVSVNRDITNRRYTEKTIRALVDDVLSAQEEERRRIARELHDETAQTLTSLQVGLRAVEESQHLDQALVTAGTLRGLVAAALAGVHRMTRGLRPNALDDHGLEEALGRLAAQTSRTTGFVVDLEVTGPQRPRLAEAVEIALYRVAQEALTNAGKHAAPKHVSVLIHRTPTMVRLVIEDDGKGFDLAQSPSDIQLGLVGMRERMRLIGGSMAVESSPGHGTTIGASVPLPAPSPVST